MNNRGKPPDSQPSDLIGTDAQGKVRIDRVIPLQWVLGIIGAGVVNAAAMYYQQQQLVEKMVDTRSELREVRSELRIITSALAAANTRDTEHSMLIQQMDRRLTNLEARKP